MLHADLSTLFWCRVVWNEDAAKKAKQSRPEYKEDPIPAKGPIALEERNTVDEARNCTKTGDYFSVRPFPIDIFVVIVRMVEVNAI